MKREWQEYFVLRETFIPSQNYIDLFTRVPCKEQYIRYLHIKPSAKINIKEVSYIIYGDYSVYLEKPCLEHWIQSGRLHLCYGQGHIPRRTNGKSWFFPN